MFKRLNSCGILTGLSLGLLSLSFTPAFSNPAATEQLWLQATAGTRLGIAEQQNQINAARQAQSNATAAQNLERQRTLELLTAQQKALLEQANQGSNQSTRPAFSPKPRQTETNNNPWVKTNPWGNTE